MSETSETPEELYTIFVIPPDTDDNDIVDMVVQFIRGRDWPAKIIDHARQMIYFVGASEVIINGMLMRPVWLEDVAGPYELDPIPPPEPPPPPPEAEPSRKGVVIANALNVRSEPFVSTTTKITSIPKDTTVFIIEDVGSWYKIVWDNKTGYAFVWAPLVKELA